MQTRILNARYRLDEPIGEGGMAVVYRGYDLVLGRPVAIKVLRGQFAADASFLRRFEREAQAAARLSHPNIVSVYDVGRDDGLPYIVMEYVPGKTLKRLILERAPFPLEEAVQIVRQVAAALDFAHHHGLVHRDIKPQNILVDERGFVKVTDFGIAKGLSDVSLTEAGFGMGTVHYVSPEQARGEPATPASDIYALGVVLYEMLTGRLPFEADSPIGLAMKHVHEPPPPPRQFNPTLPPPVEAIVLRALAKDPRQRFPTASALAQALTHWPQDAPAGMAAASRPAGPAVRPAAARSRARRAPPRSTTRSTDIGCATWLVGSAILAGLVALVVLAFQLVDLRALTGGDGQPPSSPTAVAVVASPTPVPSPVPALSPTTGPTPTPEPTPSPSPTPDMARVPDLINSTLRQAQAAAAAGNFQLAVEEVFDNVVPAGVIVRQDPPAGEQVEKGSTIRIWVSKGPEWITLIGLAGRPYTEVLQQLQALPVTVEKVEEGSRTVPEGYVIRTEPAEQVRNGGTVTVYVSVGDRVRVPDLYGKPYQQAIVALQQAGLVVRSVAPQTCDQIRASFPSFDCDQFPDGGVVSATLQWNSWVPRGSPIDIAYYHKQATP
ncbi:MAG: protein kinase [Thermomicrobium sp.]|nr:protein kinase [Thermomicrobium sp.]